MKRMLLVVVFLTTTLFSSMNWVGELEDAYDKAEKENKIIMVMLSQKGCPACKYMKESVLRNESVIKVFNKNFIAVHLDIHEDYVPLALEHVVTPTFYFLNADEKILGVIHGSKNEKDLLDELEKVKATL